MKKSAQSHYAFTNALEMADVMSLFNVIVNNIIYSWFQFRMLIALNFPDIHSKISHNLSNHIKHKIWTDIAQNFNQCFEFYIYNNEIQIDTHIILNFIVYCNMILDRIIISKYKNKEQFVQTAKYGKILALNIVNNRERNMFLTKVETILKAE